MIEFKENNNFKEGTLITVNKPFGWTSFDVVNKVRIILKNHCKSKIKVGHAGTLDPFATGLLILCTGKWTKKLHALQELEKEYITTLKLGETTPSFDRETPIDRTFPVKYISLALIKKSISKFIGEIIQIPPLYSAVKIKGQRGYKIARKGENVEISPKFVTINAINVLEYKKNSRLLSLKISCSKGTYIRALARDLGNELKSGAHIIKLQRTRIGNYKLENALEVENFLHILENFN